MKPLPLVEELEEEAAGIPCRKKRLSMKDIWVLSVQLLCLTIAVLTVFHQGIASWLGVIRQLIVIGFLLGIMAIALQEEVLRAALIFLGFSRTSSIQDIDAFLRKDLFADQVSLYLRLILLALIGLPLGLSVAYKLFVGGYSQKTLQMGNASFGFTASPGNQRIGDGLTLLPDLYRPFWVDPAINRTYGFNLFIESNNTAVIPDTPYPSYLTALQANLAEKESINLTATVNATVARMVNPTPEQRGSNDYWQSVQDYFGHAWVQHGITTANNAIWAGGNGIANFSMVFLSAWNESKSETFFSEALRIENSRSIYQATWNVTNTDATLISAKAVAPTTPGYRPANQRIIQHEFLGIDTMFANFLGEYDWHNRAGWFQFPYPTALGQPEKWSLDVNTVPALSAAMIWARATSLEGGDRPNRNPDAVAHTMYSKAERDISTIKFIPTLKRSPWLLVVLCINPALALACMVLKVLMYRSPIGDDFNSVALLSAAAKSDLSVLHGAGLSGKLKRKVGVCFSVKKRPLSSWEEDVSGETRAFLALDVRGKESNDKLDPWNVYE